MKEFIEKLIGRLEEETYAWNDGYRNGIKASIAIVNQLAEEYKATISKMENVGWIPCSGCKDCKHKECEHYRKV